MGMNYKGGHTALHRACKYHRRDVARALLASGADIHAKDNVHLRNSLPLSSLDFHSFGFFLCAA
jgi:ankyrin repeat protein